jgi:hypothetical protein
MSVCVNYYRFCDGLGRRQTRPAFTAKGEADMLSLQDCIAMADIPEDKILELARREHEPVLLAVALAAQRGSELAVKRAGAGAGTSADRGAANGTGLIGDRYRNEKDVLSVA